MQFLTEAIKHLTALQMLDLILLRYVQQSTIQ